MTLVYRKDRYLSRYSKLFLDLIIKYFSDIEQVLDEAVFLRDGQIMLHKSVDEIREEDGKSVDDLFREVFRC